MVDLANTGEEPGSRGGQSICPTASPHVSRRKIVVGDTLLQHPPASTVLGEPEPDKVPQLTSRTPTGQTTPPGNQGVPLETPRPSQAGTAAAPGLIVLSFFWRMYRSPSFLLDLRNTQNAPGVKTTTDEFSDGIVCL